MKKYSRTELCKKYGWNASGVAKQKFLEFAQARGVILQIAPSEYKIKGVYYILDDHIANYDWVPCALVKGYEICKEGLLRNINNKRIWSSTQNGYGYLRTKGDRQNIGVHRLVMETFNPIPYSEDYYVDHINGKRTDNRLENLRWVSAKGNNMYRIANWDLMQKPFMELLNLVGYEEMIKILEEQIALKK